MKSIGETHYLWRAVGFKGEKLAGFAAKRRDRKAALPFLKCEMLRFKNIKTPQKFVSTHASIYNHFNSVAPQPPSDTRREPLSRLGQVASIGGLNLTVPGNSETGSHYTDSTLPSHDPAASSCSSDFDSVFWVLTHMVFSREIKFSTRPTNRPALSSAVR